MVQDHGRSLPAAQGQGKKQECVGDKDEAEEDEEEEDTKAFDELADFSSVMIWGHEQPLDEEDDTMTRGIAEWIGFAEVVSHSLIQRAKSSLMRKHSCIATILGQRDE